MINNGYLNVTITFLSFVFSTTTLAQSVANKNAFHLPYSISNVHRTELFTYYGMPNSLKINREKTILVNSAYAVEYDEEYKIPLYAVYRYGNLTNKSEDIKERYFERPPRFHVDLRTKSRVTHDAYTGQGFDRGHMAPNYGVRNQYGHIAQLETFLMSNIAPQYKSLNRRRWAEVEKIIANKLAMDDNGTKKTSDDTKDLWIISGPVFQGDVEKLKSGVAIPIGFFKIIIRQKNHRTSSAQAIALYYPHSRKKADTEEKIVIIDWLEEVTDLDFLPNLPDKIEDKIEKIKRDINWKKL